MRDAHADPTVPPYTMDAFAHLDEVLAAAAARDAGALSEAVERRSAAVAKQYGASIEERRNMHGLLDLRASALVACAMARRGGPRGVQRLRGRRAAGRSLMGYTLELWALRVPALEAELASPTIEAAAVEGDDTLPADVVDRWEDLAGQVAAVVASGGGEVAGLLAVYVHAVVRSLGTHYGALDHTSGGGEEFRRRFLPGPAAARYGHEAVPKLVNRPIAGLSWGDYPLLGWLGTDELGRGGRVGRRAGRRPRRGQRGCRPPRRAGPGHGPCRRGGRRPRRRLRLTRRRGRSPRRPEQAAPSVGRTRDRHDFGTSRCAT